MANDYVDGATSPIARLVGRWLQERLDVPARLVAERRFASGQSGDLLDLDVELTGDSGAEVAGFVVRVEPSEENQVFLDTNFYGQYVATQALGRAGIKVPRLIGFESDPAVIGRAFYVMTRMPGRPADLANDWVAALDDAGRETIWWTAMAEMATIHRLDPEIVNFEVAGWSAQVADPIAYQVDYYRRYYEWLKTRPRPMIEAALRWLTESAPAEISTCIAWGDSRPGNQLFTAPDRCEAILDLEQISLGQAELDLGWWWYVESMRRAAIGMAHPTLEDTSERYGQMIGRPVRNMDYFTVLGGLRHAVIRMRLNGLATGDEDQHGKYPVEENLGRTLQRLAPDALTAKERSVLADAAG
jgi:aminoglycoside phosphotransferase (APT) family kinase protein